VQLAPSHPRWRCPRTRSPMSPVLLSRAVPRVERRNSDCRQGARVSRILNLTLASAASSVLRWTALACALTACNAQVKAFSAVPRHICAGERVQLQWNVVGSASVTVTPASNRLPDGPVESAGHATITPTTGTVVALHVTRTLGSPTTSTQEIEVTSPAEKPEPLTASMGDAEAWPGCSDGKVWATVHAEHFAVDLKVATVVGFHPASPLETKTFTPAAARRTNFWCCVATSP
jgi:hypothetical protein